MSDLKFQINSARDVISMRNKLLGIFPNVSDLSIKEVEQKLTFYSEEKSLNLQTLKRMVRAERLFRKFNKLEI